MPRYIHSRKFINARFKMAMDAIGSRTGDSWSNGKAIVGVHFIDFNRIHGGYTIRRIADAQGRETSPFGMQRHSASEFVALLDGIIAAAHIVKSNAGWAHRAA